MEQSYHSFLMALKGKTVTIYKGGPESKQGRLLDVKPDYITLYAQNNNNNNNNKNNQNNQNNQNNNNNQNDNNNQNTVVYYQAQHVKSVIEDTVSNSMQLMEEQEEVEHFEGETFIELIEQLVEKTVQINQGGPESKYGLLVGVSGDFLILYTEDDGLVYVNSQHVKSISEYTQNNQNNQNNQNGNVNNQQQEVQIPEWVIEDTFQDVFKHLSHQWVSINRGGPEAMEGVLVENVGGHYTLVNNQEIMRIHPYHIKSISSGPKGYLKQNNQNNNQDNSQNDNQNNNQNSNENNNQSENKDSSKNSDGKSEKNEKKSGSSSKHSSKEKVVKTIDYNWKV